MSKGMQSVIFGVLTILLAGAIVAAINDHVDLQVLKAKQQYFHGDAGPK